MVELELKHRLCFPFCPDLGNKKVYQAKKGLDDQINLKWSLFRVKQHTSLMGGGGVELPNSDIVVPGNYTVERVKGDWTSAWSDPEYTTFVAPDDYYRDGKIFYNTTEKFTIDLPKEIEEQPHLHKHSTFLFSYLKNDIVSCSCQFLKCENGKIKIKILVSASPSGTYLIWKSGTISFKWKIEVRQDIVVMNLMKEHLQDMWNTSKKVGKGVLKFATLGAIDLDDKDMGGVIDKMAKEAGGKDHWKKMGMKKEKKLRDQEKQMQRMVASTITNEATLEPPVLASEAIHLPYNLFDYGLRSVFKPHWQYRIYVSENLLNNLIHNNNENPITYPLNITFKKLGNILRKGYWQGKLTLDYDPGGNMAKCFARGVWFYEDKEKDFPDPDLGVKSLVDQVGLTGFGGTYYTAQALTEPDEPWENNITRTKGTNYHQRAHFFIFYEDGSQDHWLVLFPQSFQDSHLAQGHTHGGFDIKFDKPVLKMIDVYTCIGCGAKSNQKNGQTTPGFLDLHSDYDGGNDSLDYIHKGLPFEPWYSKMTSVSLNSTKHWITADNDRCLGWNKDVWEFTGQYIVGKDNKPFQEAYGYIPTGGTIQWRTKGGGGGKIKLQKDPGHDDFDKMDWTPPPGSGGDTEIPLMDPGIPEPEPGADGVPPEYENLPEFDYTGPGEPEIAPLEPDITQEPDFAEDDPGFEVPEVDPPEVTPPDADLPKDNEPDKGEKDPGDDDDEKPEDFD